MSGKLKREVIGSFLKAKEDSKPPYIKIKNDVVFKANDIVRVENKKFQLQSIETAVATGKLSPEIAAKAQERINKIPEFVIAELVVLRS
jgi:uncharacterized Zn finger protein